MRTTIFLFLFFVSLLIVACGPKGTIDSESKPISHKLWDSLLQDYVSEKGNVNYKEIQKDSGRLNEYLNLLSNNHPNSKNWSPDEQLAYWINAYNAFTVKLIVKNYPIESIKELGGSLYKINTPWDIQFIHIEGQTYDLNNIEHGIIRSNFEEPRIHFAVNCASESCPKLMNRAYTAEELSKQLDVAAKDFINNPSKNNITSDKAQLSKIFTWFKGDFTKNGTLVEFINKYSNTRISEDTAIEYLDYSWKLNE